MTTSYDVLCSDAAAVRVGRSEVLAVCMALEARTLTIPPVRVLATIQDVRFVSRRAREVWSALAAADTEVTVAAPGLPGYLGPGVRCVTLAEDDPRGDVWSFAVEWADATYAAMAGRDAPVEQMSSAHVRADDDRTFLLVESSDPVRVGDALAVLDTGRLTSTTAAAEL